MKIVTSTANGILRKNSINSRKVGNAIYTNEILSGTTQRNPKKDPD